MRHPRFWASLGAVACLSASTGHPARADHIYIPPEEDAPPVTQPAPTTAPVYEPVPVYEPEPLPEPIYVPPPMDAPAPPSEPVDVEGMEPTEPAPTTAMEPEERTFWGRMSDRARRRGQTPAEAEAAAAAEAEENWDEPQRNFWGRMADRAAIWRANPPSQDWGTTTTYGKYTGRRTNYWRELALSGDPTAYDKLVVALQYYPVPAKEMGVLRVTRKGTHVYEGNTTLPREPNPILTRRDAAEALGVLGDPRAVQALEDALNDPDFLVRYNAARSITQIQQRSY